MLEPSADILALIDEFDLPEPTKALAAWWEPVGEGGHACGLAVLLVDGTTWYLESLCVSGDTTFADPLRVRALWKKPKSRLYVSSLTWNIETEPLTAELDVIYCRSRP